jgi:hypothetical protein
VNLLHGRASRLHGGECLMVNISRFDSVYLLLQLCDLSLCLFVVLLVDLFSSKGGLGNCGSQLQKPA